MYFYRPGALAGALQIPELVTEEKGKRDLQGIKYIGEPSALTN